MERLKKILPLFMLFVMVAFAIEASPVCSRQKENHKSRMAEFFQQKKEYLIKEVGMTKEESDKFFPLYDEMQRKKFMLHKEVREKIKKIQGSTEAISEAEYAEAARAMNDLKLKEARLDSEYYQKFTGIFSAEKLYKLQNAENNFSREMLKKGNANRHGTGK